MLEYSVPNFSKEKRLKWILVVGGIAIVVAIVAGIIYNSVSSAQLSDSQNPEEQVKTPAEKDIYVRFIMEGYDKIADNYWMKEGKYSVHGAAELPELMRLSIKKASSLDAVPPVSDRNSTANMIADVLDYATSTEAKKQLALQTLTVLTYNLLPVGRNALFSAEQETALRQRVSNFNPETGKVEPTVFTRIIGETFYAYFKQISPSSLQEFGLALEKASTTKGINNMIIDLRGNVGGDLSFANAFTGLFIGQNQYAYDLFRKEKFEPERTILPKFRELERFREIAILTDEKTQSTAELTTAVLKRLNIARVIGKATAGWGTIENTYELKTVIDPAQKFSLFLVNSLTLGDDNQPIESNGVKPTIDTSKAGWSRELGKYFDSASFIKLLQDRISASPMGMHI